MLDGLTGALVVAVVNFLMVFLILGGLALSIKGLQRLVQALGLGTGQAAEVSGPAAEPPQDSQTPAHIAAITAAISEFTQLPPGSFKIDTIEPTAALHDQTASEAAVTPAQIAAMAAAIHEFTNLPQGAFRITTVRPVQAADTWKMAGRFEKMGLETEHR